VYQAPTTVIGYSYIFSFFVKNSTATISHYQVRTSNTAAFGTLTWSGATLTAVTPTIGTASFVDVGNGWYRVIATYTATETAARHRIGGGDNTSTTGNVFVWGAQLNTTNTLSGVTSSLTTYYPTTTAAYYAPRFTYNPSTLQPLGLLIEEARTNSIRNNTMQGAVAGTPGTLPTNWSVAGAAGLTTNVIGTGTSNGVIYVDLQVTGTSSATSYILAFDTTTQIAASVGQNWAWSSWIAFVGGSLSNVTTVSADFRESNSGGTQLAAGTVALSTLTSSLVRQSATRTLSEATTAFIQPRLRLTITNGAAIDITLRIGLPQLELGAFATSVIPTTTTALTRNADNDDMTGSNFSSWYNASEGTLLVEYAVNATGYNGGAAALSDGTFNNRMIIRGITTTNTAASIGVESGSTQWNNGFGGQTTAATKFALAYKTNDIAFTRNGATPLTDTVANIPTVNQLRIGADADGTIKLNGTIRRIAYYPTRLPDATLQALTA
jgi:hypothetical protein